jgi:hypothetical protein
MELLGSGGIKVYSVFERKEIEIPEKYLNYDQNESKLGSCIIYVDKYVAQMMSKQFDNAI